MKIVVREIPARGLQISQEIEPAMIGLEDANLNILPPLKVTGKAELIDNTVLVHVDVKAKYVFTCARCLEIFEQTKTNELEFDYSVDKTVKVIDLGDDIRQEIIMDLPVRILCKEDCKGICLGCGVNLNLENCKCES